jgi:hypothetical protein
MKGPTVEVLYFDGCPHHEEPVRLVERVAAELGVEPEIIRLKVPVAETAQRKRFLGSPSIRVDGCDVDPEACERSEYVHSCRVYRTDSGGRGQPDERWVRAALAAATSHMLGS